MRWADTDLLWGRPLRSILAVYNKKVLPFNYGHLKANEYTFIEKDLDIKSKKILNFSDYQKLLLNNNIILDQEKRKKIITNKLEYFCKQKKLKNNLNTKILEEVTNIVDDPNLILL